MAKNSQKIQRMEKVIVDKSDNICYTIDTVMQCSEKCERQSGLRDGGRSGVSSDGLQSGLNDLARQYTYRFIITPRII